MQYGLKQTTAPAAEPITVGEVDLHTRIDIADETSLVNGLITMAREYAELRSGYQLMPATWKMYLEGFHNEIIVPRPPLSSVTSITYVDTDGNTQTVTSSIYAVSAGREPGRIWLGHNQIWPSTRGFKEDVIIEYVAGYATAQLVPQSFKQAMLMLIDQMYNARADTVEAAIAVMPNSSKEMLTGLWHGYLPEEMVA